MTTHTVDEEKAALEAAQGGDESALVSLIQTHQHRIHNYVARLVPQSADAEDITQEVLLEMIKAIKTFRGEASLATWLFRIATNKISDFFRKRAKHRTFWLDETRENGTVRPEIPDTRPGPLDTLDHQEREALVDRVFGKLPEVYRSVLILRVQEGLSYQQMAEVLGCAVGTVKSRIHYGMILMGKGLAEVTAGGSRQC